MEQDRLWEHPRGEAPSRGSHVIPPATDNIGRQDKGPHSSRGGNPQCFRIEDEARGDFVEKKSRVKWLQEGERNTKFFHQIVIKHKHFNRIFSLKNQECRHLVHHEEITEELILHFQTLFTEMEVDIQEAIQQIQQHIPSLISKDQNEALMLEISLKEVEEVVKALLTNKALSPDGFTIEFFKVGWKFLGKKILDILEYSRRYQWLWAGLNATFLAPIPKKGEALDSSRFFLISLCNVIYKILSRILVRRLKPLFKTIIGLEKTSFVEGRKIFDGIMVAHEVVHTLS